MENEVPSPGRLPNQSDLIALCRSLNKEGARYLVVGGFALTTTVLFVPPRTSIFWLMSILKISAALRRHSKFYPTKQFWSWETTTCEITPSSAYPTIYLSM